MIDLQNECYVRNGIMPGLGELHHRYPILKFFRASTRKHPSIANDSYVDFCCFQRTTHSMKRKRCRSSFSRSPKVERNISLWLGFISRKISCGACSSVWTQTVVLSRLANCNYAFIAETENFCFLSLPV